MSEEFRPKKPNIERTDVHKMHDRAAAAFRVADTAEDSYLEMAAELIDARNMYANAIAEADHLDPVSDKGKKQAERIEQLGQLIVQMQLLLDDDVELTNEKYRQYEALKNQMKKHLN